MSMQSSRRTPIDDSYPTCERTCAALRIYPGEITPEEVSPRLKLLPTSQQTTGEQQLNRIGRIRVARLNGWFLSSESAVKSMDLRRHLDWLLDKLEPTADALRVLQIEPGTRMAVNCIWWSKTGQGGPTLWPEQMSRLAALNLECSFDVSFYGDDEDDRQDARLTSPEES